MSVCNAFGVTTYLGNTVRTDDLLFGGIVFKRAPRLQLVHAGPIFAPPQPWCGFRTTKRVGWQANRNKENDMTLGTILLIILILLLVGALPTWPHSRSWGYYPSGGLGVVLIIVIILLLVGAI
jgi:hypothetical protein